MYAPWHIKFKKKNVFKLASIAPKNNINKIGFLAKYLYFHILKLYQYNDNIISVRKRKYLPRKKEEN